MELTTLLTIKRQPDTASSSFPPLKGLPCKPLLLAPPRRHTSRQPAPSSCSSSPSLNVKFLLASLSFFLLLFLLLSLSLFRSHYYLADSLSLHPVSVFLPQYFSPSFNLYSLSPSSRPLPTDLPFLPSTGEGEVAEEGGITTQG